MNYYIKALKDYAKFTGRSRRKEYWLFFLFNMLISYALIFLGIFMEMPALGIVSTVYSLATLIPSLAVGARRMHDVGKSGWYMLIPIYNLILFCTDGDNGSNEYGADPKLRHAEFDFDKTSAL